MPGIFDGKVFNAEVFAAKVEATPNLRLTELLKSKAVKQRNDLKPIFPDQLGGNFATVPIVGRISGDALNYDGSTDITATSLVTYAQGRVVIGRAKGWIEKDFASDLTGQDFMAEIAAQVGEYWDGIDQDTLISTLKGIFGMTGTKNLVFVNQHTYDVSANMDATGLFGGTTLNNAAQKALGDNKAKFSLICLHSVPATNLENLKLLEYMKYTDAQGIERSLALATLNGRLVLVDDSMPYTDVVATYVKSVSGATGALEVIADAGTITGAQIKLASVTPRATGYTASVGDFVVLDAAHTNYTSFLMGDGAIEFTDCGAKVPYETDRDPKTNGGQDTLYNRQRKIFAPAGISWKGTTILSPTNAQLETAANWTLAADDASATNVFPHKAIPIARVITRG